MIGPARIAAMLVLEGECAPQKGVLVISSSRILASRRVSCSLMIGPARIAAMLVLEGECAPQKGVLVISVQVLLHHCWLRRGLDCAEGRKASKSVVSLMIA